VYCLYVDLFSGTFQGLEEKLDYLQKLGVNCLWLLPMLESPMKDAGFDISDFLKLRKDLLPPTLNDAEHEEQAVYFAKFLEQAHRHDIKVIFDVAINHVSVEHPWFKEALDDKPSPYKDFFHWADSDMGYPDARIIFKGIMKSNWSKAGEKYYLHRFFDHQPDLNYRNPKVLLEISKVFIHWMKIGVDGFRADAIPFVWKEHGTSCESLPQVHEVLRFFRSVLDYLRPGTLLLAEACQPPYDVVSYFGKNDECHAAYHFPLMPRIFASLATEDRYHIQHTLSPNVTPNIPSECQWFSFLRVHDELTLEMVDERERQLLHQHYCREPLWNFREGEGISARLFDLLDGDVDKILMATSINFTLLGTPILFYGDEVGKPSDTDFFTKFAAQTGIPDSRYLCRGYMDWRAIEQELDNPSSKAHRIFHEIAKMCQARRTKPVLSRGTLKFLVDVEEEGPQTFVPKPYMPESSTADATEPEVASLHTNAALFGYKRCLSKRQSTLSHSCEHDITAEPAMGEEETMLIIHNLSSRRQLVAVSELLQAPLPSCSSAEAPPPESAEPVPSRAPQAGSLGTEMPSHDCLEHPLTTVTLNATVYLQLPRFAYYWIPL